jgi:Ca-activated chloride channel family protein
VGEYGNPAKAADFSFSAQRDGEPLQIKAPRPLPEHDTEHPFLPRTWARARVDALLEKIERDGEDRASIDEILRLARKYKFVTPYTSFLAVPRSLLRPRVIKPGDPVLRVRTDRAIVSVTALFPFGLTKPLRYLPHEDMWQTRFLAPADMQDGTYSVRLLMRDTNGRVYNEQKTFVIASKPPIVKIKLPKQSLHRGDAVLVQASASDLTRTVTARMFGAAPVSLRWNEKLGMNAGTLLIPETLPPGKYKLTVTAEDVARNVGSEEIAVEVLP